MVTIWVVVAREDVPRLVDGVRGSERMEFETLDTVALNTDIPSEGLRKNDLGTVVQVYEPDGLEVEFVTAAGGTRAVVTLTVRDVRAVDDQDLVAVRRSV